jgi:hypothetical protein
MMQTGLLQKIHSAIAGEYKRFLGFNSIYDIMKYKLMHNCDIIQECTYMIGFCYECIRNYDGKYIFIEYVQFHICNDCIASIGEKEVEFINNEVMLMMLIAELPIVADIQREIYTRVFAMI